MELARATRSIAEKIDASTKRIDSRGREKRPSISDQTRRSSYRAVAMKFAYDGRVDDTSSNGDLLLSGRLALTSFTLPSDRLPPTKFDRLSRSFFPSFSLSCASLCSPLCRFSHFADLPVSVALLSKILAPQAPSTSESARLPVPSLICT